MSSRAWIWWLAAGAVLTAGTLALGVGSTVRDCVYVATGFASVAVMALGLRRNRPQRARVWYLLLVGQAFTVLGDVTWTFLAHVLHRDPYPSIADAVYLAGYPPLIAAMIQLVRDRTNGRDRDGLMDAAMATTGAGLLVWVLLIRPVTEAGSAGPASLSVALAYPVFDLLLLALVFRLLTTPGARTAGFGMLVGAQLLVLVGDIVFSIITSVTDYAGGATDAAWLASYVLYGAVALHPSVRTLSEPAPARAARVTGTRVAAVAATSQVIPLVLTYQGMTDPANIEWLPISVASVVLFLLVAVRVYGLLERVRRQARQLRELANNDELTGLPNRRAWDATLHRAMTAAARDGRPLVVALLDLDLFKQVNDEHGHQAGDRLLKESAAAWRAALRAGDELARYGGEEFAVLICGLELDAAEALVARLLAATPRGRTFTAGLARWDGAEAADELLARADRALYQGKESGRAKVVRAPAPGRLPSQRTTA